MTWGQMEFDHEPHPRTGIMLIGASEELIETLEDNQARKTKFFFDAFYFHKNYHYFFYVFTGTTAKYDDVQICWLLLGASFGVAKKTFHRRLGYCNLV